MILLGLGTKTLTARMILSNTNEIKRLKRHAGCVNMAV